MLWDQRGKDRNEAAAPAAALADAGQIFPTKALRKFLSNLTSRESPVLMDLGPVVGSNVTFFGERLGCKIILEDLFGDLERYPKNAEVPFADYLKTRLKHEDGSVDGILCWNFFDYLDWRSAQALAAALTKVLRPDGTVLAFFTTVGAADTRFSKYVIMDEDSVKQRPYSSGGKKQTSFQNRDIIRMFEGLKVAESFLLKTNVREFLFKKPV
ncbi:MAG TPA: class I SAM-dependent methyltransferase [Vicinamibacterales bacterium]|nr:class I SAM-dependent methyltransferase [Vicinamibacterales bacterium]